MKRFLNIAQKGLDKLLFGFTRLPSEGEPIRVKRRSGILASLEEGVYATIYLTLVSGKFLMDLVLSMGAAAIHLGLINAIPFLAAPAQLGGAYLVSKIGSRKKVLIPAIFICRQLWWFVLATTLLPIESRTKLWIFILLYIIMNISGQVSGNAWLSWLSDLFPDNLRGRIVSARNGILIIIAMMSDFLFSQLRETFGKNGKQIFLLLTLAVASLAGLKTVIAFKNQWEPPHLKTPSPRLVDIINQIGKIKAVRRLVIALMLWNIAVGVATAFWTPHMMINLKMSFTKIFLYSTIVMIFSFLMSRLIWGHVIDRAGTVSVVTFCSFLISFIPFLWLFITPDNITPIWLEAVLNGLVWSGFNIAIFNLPFYILPKKNQSYFFAILSAITGIALGMGAIIGGIIAQILEDFHIEIAGIIYVNYHVTFVLSGILRGACVFLLRKIPDTRSRGMIFMLKMVGDGLVRATTNPRLILYSSTMSPRKKQGQENQVILVKKINPPDKKE
ncbi:MFS transporter [Candidatus Sumerlaeota bacterium]|nr:MFS transporter [Candidatus Sumerlaeota bacterium]